MRAITRVVLFCKQCGKEFSASKSDTTRGFCNLVCYREHISNPPITGICLECGTPFVTRDRKQKCCSQSCAGKIRKGPSANAFKDGKSLERERGRLTPEFREWRKKVFERDNFTCQTCGIEQHLHAHHIKFWADYPDLRFELANGITLCQECHGAVHGMNFSNRVNRSCITCGKERKWGKPNTNCLSCAAKIWHAEKGEVKSINICPVCSNQFSTYHHEQVHCSVSCGLKSRKGEKRKLTS